MKKDREGAGKCPLFTASASILVQFVVVWFFWFLILSIYFILCQVQFGLATGSILLNFIHRTININKSKTSINQWNDISSFELKLWMLIFITLHFSMLPFVVVVLIHFSKALNSSKNPQNVQNKMINRKCVSNLYENEWSVKVWVQLISLLSGLVLCVAVFLVNRKTGRSRNFSKLNNSLFTSRRCWCFVS